MISFDNRHGSKRFAEWTARVLASQGIRVYLSDQLRPTPQLSFLVRYYKAFAGVMITASHNLSNTMDLKCMLRTAVKLH